MRPDLTSAEIAMSGSYFDDVLRDPRRYGIENTTDKVRRRGAVRRRRDAVCTERSSAIRTLAKKRPSGKHQFNAVGLRRMAASLKYWTYTALRLVAAKDYNVFR